MVFLFAMSALLLSRMSNFNVTVISLIQEQHYNYKSKITQNYYMHILWTPIVLKFNAVLSKHTRLILYERVKCRAT